MLLLLVILLLLLLFILLILLFCSYYYYYFYYYYQARPGQARPGQARSDQIRSDRIRSDQTLSLSQSLSLSTNVYYICVHISTHIRYVSNYNIELRRSHFRRGQDATCGPPEIRRLTSGGDTGVKSVTHVMCVYIYIYIYT